MFDKETAERIEYLERNIAEFGASIDYLQCKPFGVSISSEVAKLRGAIQSMTSELNELRPFAVVTNGSTFIVSHRGNYVRDETGEYWLIFATREQAEAWISDAMADADEVAA